MKKLIILILAALVLSGPVYASDITWSVTTPSGTVTWTSPELDTIDPGATEPRWERFINWTCDAYTLMDDNGTPNDPSDDTVIPCDTNGQKAQHVQAWMTAQWRGTKGNVLRWEETEGVRGFRAGLPGFE